MNPIPDLQELVAPLAGLSQPELARAAVEMGVPVGTLYRIKMGYSESCRYKTARKISLYLSRSSTADSPTDGPGHSAQ